MNFSLSAYTPETHQGSYASGHFRGFRFRSEPIERRSFGDFIPSTLSGLRRALTKEEPAPKRAYYIPGKKPSDFLNAPVHEYGDTVDVPVAEPAEEKEEELDLTDVHKNPEFIARVRDTPYDNAVSAGKISDPAVADHVNKIYTLAIPGLELVKGRGGRGGEGGAGYKLKITGQPLSEVTPEVLRNTLKILRELHTSATGRTAKRIEKDMSNVQTAINRFAPPPMVGGGAGTGAVAPADSESEADTEASSSEEEAPTLDVKEVYTGKKYTFHEMESWKRGETVTLAGTLGIPNVGFKKLSDLKRTIAKHTETGT